MINEQRGMREIIYVSTFQTVTFVAVDVVTGNPWLACLFSIIIGRSAYLDWKRISNE